MEISIDKKERISFVSITGEFHLSNVELFEAEWSRMIEKKTETVAIDCSNIVFIDSTALGSFVKFLKYLVQYNIQLVFCDLNFEVDRLFKATMLEKIFVITTREKLELEYA